ncbi:'Cold-shock' DNA-Hypothetical protein domain [Nesidiocoris tenuis]|uniref:CSD domain-containing protein n=1 Tax=Nesidiocoris tenuis TaxID=355587 RepID=A0ABN7BHQ2_9HEMI|nr:'Cold-shock' DNA-Hypothetical protein domain [Nesidiocoris tenuis]
MGVVNIINDGEKEPAAGSTPADKQGDNKGQSNKPYLALKVTGTVKWFNVKSGYGFINRKDTGEDVFVHQSAIVKNNPKKAVRSVGDGETVEFDVVEGEKGNEAANVTGPGGEAVKGSPYAADKRRGFRQWFFGGGRRPRSSRKSGDLADGEEGGDGEDSSQNEKPRRYRNRRMVSGSGGGGYYPRRTSMRPEKNGEKEGGEGGDEGGDEEGGRPAGDQRPERGAPRGRGGRGRRYPIYRGGRQGPPKSRQQQGDGGEGGPKEGGGGEGGSIERGGRGGGRGRGRPRYRRPQRSQSQADKPPKSSEGGQNSEANEAAPAASAPPAETTQAVQNTTDESAA